MAENGQTIAGQTGKTLSITQAGTYTIKATGNVGGGSECTVKKLPPLWSIPNWQLASMILRHARAK